MAEKFENVCVECSKPFETEEVESTYCPECWEKLMEENLADEGE